MGWIGPLWIGLAVGAASHWLHPRGARRGLRAAMLSGAAGALLAYYGGQFAHFFADGQVLAWMAAVAGAAVAPLAWRALRAR